MKIGILEIRRIEKIDAGDLKCPVCSRNIPMDIYLLAKHKGKIIWCTYCGARLKWRNGSLLIIGFRGGRE